MGCTSSHHAARRDIVKLLPVSCADLIAVYRLTTTDSAISRCLLHMNSPRRSLTQPTGSRTYVFSGGSSRSAKTDQAEDEVEVKPRQSVSSRRPLAARIRTGGWHCLIPDRARLASEYQISSSENGSL